MTTMTVSAKRQVVLPADLCRQIAITPGAKVEVELSPSGDGILVRAAVKSGKKPASVLFGRVSHRGTPVAIEELQGLAVAHKLAGTNKP